MDEQKDEKGIEEGSVRTAAGVAPLLLTIPQAASVLAVGRTTVYELIGAGDLEAVHIGRSVRVPVDALRSFVNRRATKTSSARTAGALSRESSRPGPSGSERLRGEYGSQSDRGGTTTLPTGAATGRRG
jgi:excisionase family DNA binding protein